MNTPPFKVGQKVVALKDSRYGHFKKGGIYTVVGIKIFCKCGHWVVDIGAKTSVLEETCDDCGTKRDTNGIPWRSVEFFAPIEESRTRISYVAVSESLRQTAIEIAAVETN